MNRHDWVSEHITPPKPCTPAEKEDNAQFRFTFCGEQMKVSFMVISIGASVTNDKKPIYVDLDYCLKHGEWRTVNSK